MLIGPFQTTKNLGAILENEQEELQKLQEYEKYAQQVDLETSQEREDNITHTFYTLGIVAFMLVIALCIVPVMAVLLSFSTTTVIALTFIAFVFAITISKHRAD